MTGAGEGNDSSLLYPKDITCLGLDDLSRALLRSDGLEPHLALENDFCLPDKKEIEGEGEVIVSDLGTGRHMI